MPPSLRKDVLLALHSAHSGITSMMSCPESSVFWPGITSAIHATHQQCSHCNHMAPSQPSAPPTPPTPTIYPFQCVCTDFFSYKAFTYLIYVDCNSNWPVIERSSDGAKGLINSLCHAFATYSVPKELASDGRPKFQATLTNEFLQTWGAHHRLSSAAFPHSNNRAEVGVKSAKRIITNNTGPNGCFNVNAVQRAIVLYSKETHQILQPNSPLPSYSSDSPLGILFQHYLDDTSPTRPGRKVSLPANRPFTIDACS